MMGASSLLLASGYALVVVGGASAVFALAKKPVAPRPTLGHRGLKRAEVLRVGGWFALVEPTLRYLAARMSGFAHGPIRLRIGHTLRQSGDYLGLSEDELLGMSALLGAILGASTWFGAPLLGLPSGLAAFATLAGALAPWARIRAIAKARARRVNRGLPAVIDLAAMCMSAGLDFPSALRRIVDSAPSPEEPIIDELCRVLQELDFGRTRRQAMLALVERIPTDEVRELANSVVQAEEKGTPLSRVLAIQARTLRLRRSITAEETASEAALLLIGPMTLIFLCVLALLLGPVVLRFATGGFESI